VAVGLGWGVVLVGDGKEGGIDGCITLVALGIIGDGGVIVQAEIINNMKLTQSALKIFFTLFESSGVFMLCTHILLKTG
jgi:hypothetical protein